MRVDLHLHSTASDGTMTPAQLMQAAHTAGMDLVSLTDHDSCGGIAEAQKEAARLGLSFLPGIEISCGGDREIHILGYGVDPLNPQLRVYHEEHVQERIQRTEQMLSQLREQGLSLDRERMMEGVSGIISRTHIAKAICDCGYAGSIREAFDHYLVPGRPGYVPKKVVSVQQGCAMIRQAGGLPVLAHPMQLRCGEDALEPLIREWAGNGLAGLEVYHPSTANNKIRMLLGIAGDNGLVITGGSDFHGLSVRNTMIGQGTERIGDVPGLILSLYRSMGQPVPQMLSLQENGC